MVMLIDKDCTEPRLATENLTLRDYFAAKAMQAFSEGVTLPLSCTKNDASELFIALAERAYWISDAMLEARKNA